MAGKAVKEKASYPPLESEGKITKLLLHVAIVSNGQLLNFSNAIHFSSTGNY